MAIFYQIDGKVARAAIAEGEYQDFLLLSKEVSNLKLIYVFNSNTQELRGGASDDSVNKAMKHAKVNLYKKKFNRWRYPTLR